MSKEQKRLDESYQEKKKWLKWGPYLSERQWGTVREDYSADGNAWGYFPHDHARSRAYRWGEDGIAGITDRYCNLNFSLALWNTHDPIIKERLFGLTGPEGNHAEDVKELYYYLDSTPTHSYMKHLYKYPLAAFPYDRIVKINKARSKWENEYELLDTGIFDEGRYFDVFTEYAKADVEDILIKITIHNRGVETAPLVVMPHLWCTNLWDAGLMKRKPEISRYQDEKEYSVVRIDHPKIGEYFLYFQTPERFLFAENETNRDRIFDQPNQTDRPKDAINNAVIADDYSKFEGIISGTKFTPLYQLEIPAGDSISLRLRLSKKTHNENPLKAGFEKVFTTRIQEADEFYRPFTNPAVAPDLANIQRQAFAGMLWSKQYYYIDIPQWLKGDNGFPTPPPERKKGRNSDWKTLNNQDIISMPDKWEYPWYAAWDLAFHCVPLAQIDPEFAKEQLILFLREWYMKPNGQLPAYEWSFGDVNPPVHAWGCLQVYRIDKEKNGKGDINFLKRVFQKLLINFTWWVNRKDHMDNNIFEGGFLGLDNIGVFDRSTDVPGGGYLEQADGTSWMAMYSLNMLDMALEIAQEDPVGFEDTATKFLEHFVYIAEALNQRSEDWIGSWDPEEEFFYDVITLPDGRFIPLKVRSLVGLSTLFATLVIEKGKLEKLPDFKRRLLWFKRYRSNNRLHLVMDSFNQDGDMLLSLVPKDRLSRLLHALLDEKEFFSLYGIRSLSKIHQEPYVVNINGQEFGLTYQPAESRTNLFGGNSNWRGPIWLPMNYLIILSLRELDKFYGDEMRVECPSDSGKVYRLSEVADIISENLIDIFKLDSHGKRPFNDLDKIYEKDPHFRDLVLFYEYFHGDTGRGVGASHQTGWTGLVATLISRLEA